MKQKLKFGLATFAMLIVTVSAVFADAKSDVKVAFDKGDKSKVYKAFYNAFEDCDLELAKYIYSLDKDAVKYSFRSENGNTYDTPLTTFVQRLREKKADELDVEKAIEFTKWVLKVCDIPGLRMGWRFEQGGVGRTDLDLFRDKLWYTMLAGGKITPKLQEFYDFLTDEVYILFTRKDFNDDINNNYGGKVPEKYTIPDGYTNIDYNALPEGIVDLTIPEGIEYACYFTGGVKKTLKRLTVLSKKITLAIKNFPELEYVYLSKGVSDKGPWDMRQQKYVLTGEKQPYSWDDGLLEWGGNPKIKTVEIDPENPTYFVKDGMLFKRNYAETNYREDGKLLLYKFAGTEYTLMDIFDKSQSSIEIPEGVTRTDYDFRWKLFPNLKKVRFPTTFQIVRANEFAGNQTIETVIFENGSTTIGETAFNSCKNLKSVTWSKDLALNYENQGGGRFGRAPFVNCTALESMDMPYIVQFGSRTFSSCSALKSIVIGPCTVTTGSFTSPLESLTIRSKTPPKFEADELVKALARGQADDDIKSFVGTWSKNAKIYVPVGCASAYKNDKFWGKLGFPIEESDKAAPVNDLVDFVKHNESIFNTRNQFFAAAEKGDKATVEKLLNGTPKNILTVDAQNEKGKTALYIAAENGRTELAKYLLSKGAKVNVTAGDGWPMVTAAARSGNAEIVKMLLSKGAKIEAKNGRGVTPMFAAAASGNKDVVQYLFSEGSQRYNADGESLVSWAAFNGKKNVVEFLLSNGMGIDTQNNDSSKNTPIHSAAKGGSREVVEFLLSKGAKVDAKNGGGYTPLHVAAENGQKNIVEFLLSKGANIEESNNGKTPLYMASKYGHVEVMKFLLSKKANPNVVYNNSWTPLILAADIGSTEAVELLLSNGANIEAKRKNGMTALFTAARNGHFSTTEILLKKGANIDPKLEDGCTPLIYAASEGYSRVVRLLLKRGADVNAKQSGNIWTALHWAARNDYGSVVWLLIENGADVFAKDKDGKTPLFLAAWNAQTTAVQVMANLLSESDWKALTIGSYIQPGGGRELKTLSQYISAHRSYGELTGKSGWTNARYSDCESILSDQRYWPEGNYMEGWHYVYDFAHDWSNSNIVK